MDDVVILAGGKCPDDLAEASGTIWRADLSVSGKSMLETVREAVGSWCEPVVVGGPDQSSPRQVAAGASFVESLEIGMRATKGKRILLATVDLPFLTREAIQSFVDASPADVALAYPIVPAELCQRDFPELKRTVLALKEGRFTGGNIALFEREGVLRSLPMFRRAYEARKNPVQLAQIVGIGTLARLLVGRFIPSLLPIVKLEQAVSKTLDFSVKAVICEHASIGTDIDTLEQWQAITARARSDA